jgi:hypothetical protein
MRGALQDTINTFFSRALTRLSLSLCGDSAATIKRPLIRLPTFSPTRGVGEKALDGKESRKECEKCALAPISHTFLSDSLASSDFFPRAFRGEKVPKADEGALQDGINTLFASGDPIEKASHCPVLCATLTRQSNAPSSGFATFSPTRSVGEKALDGKESRKECEKCALAHISHAFQRHISIECLLPRAFRGEKVPRAD